MLKALVSQDLVLGFFEGDGDGLAVPINLHSVPPLGLRAVDGVLIDVRENSTWYVDPNGNKHIVRHDLAWPSLTCSWDAVMTPGFTPGTWRLMTGSEALRDSVSAECSRRIRVRASTNTQMNMATYVSSLFNRVVVLGETLNSQQTDDIQTADAIRNWIAGPNGMLERARSLVSNADPDFALDSKWPAWNPAWDAFTARF
jgi:hypothetical protein